MLSGADVTAVLEFFAEAPVEPDAELLSVMAYVGALLGRVVERTRAQDALRVERASLDARVTERTRQLEAVRNVRPRSRASTTSARFST